MTIGAKSVHQKAAALAAAVLALPTGVWAGEGNPYYERAFVLAADARCGLFEPQLKAALNAAAWQARGAALRGGASDVDVAAAAGRARARAATVACADPELATVQGRVQAAFAGWARTPRMSFDGWKAERLGREKTAWRLVQAGRVGASPVSLGYAGQGRAASGDLTAVVSFVGAPRPYAARLVMRDPAKAPRPWLAGDRLPPETMRASRWASGFSAAEPSLLGEDRRAGEAWRFGPETAAAIERLDPREPLALEFHFRDGSVATARFTVGDFAAGRAFLAMGML